MKQKAFTLVELLAVIAIIAVLAAILLPIFVKAQKRAKQTQCVSNLHQVGMANNMYLSDWDNRYPWAYYNEVVDDLHPGIARVLDPYVRDADVWRCPSDIGETFPLGPLGYRHPTPPWYTWPRATSYEYFGVWPVVGTYVGRLAGVPLSKIKRPATEPT